ncbi:MAG: hypothetical protein NVS3B7_06200 [Candidatus Elarobacter sp.]
MAVRIEDVKRDGIAIDIDALAQSGFEAISDEDRYRLKTQGVCTQRQVGAFMLRIRVPGGKATPEQLRCVAELADRFGHASVHVTSRGGLELHHVRIGDVPAVWDALDSVGLTTKGTCGDTVRNVIACSHAGTYAGEVLPPDPFARLLDEHIVAISDDTNISRKVNVAIACSPDCDDHVATSDIGFVAVEGDGGRPGFALWGAGGLGAAPRLAIEIAPFIAQEDLLPAFTALLAFGEKYANRQNRAKAKIKMLVEAWGVERVREVFAEEFKIAQGRPFPALVLEQEQPHRVSPASRLGGVVEQRQAGRFTVPALIPMGELASDVARALADAADRFGDGVVHLTPEQNAELHDVAAGDVDAVVASFEALGMHTRGRGGIADVLSCVGLEYCALAVAGSMTLGEEIARAMEPRRTDPRYVDFRIHVSGCPHSCAKHQVADIGLAGGTTEFEGRRVEAFVLYVGGNARERRLGSTFSRKIPRSRALPVVEAVLAVYERERIEDERFSATVARVGTAAFFGAAGAALDGVSAVPDVVAGELVVIGNGMSGARLVEEIRRRGGEALNITVYGDEPGGNYNRIMLSGVLGRNRTAGEIVTHPPEWYAEHDVTLRSGVRIAHIDRERRVVIDEAGNEQRYDGLVIATGSRPFVPAIPGRDHARVRVFRTLADCNGLHEEAALAQRAVVLGGGLLGLEAASGLRALGVEVTVLHLMPSLMEQQLDAGAGMALRARIEALDIAVRTDARTTEIRAFDAERLEGVALADGTLIPADLVVICCGIIPNVEVARNAGLDVKRGIVVDDGLRTSDPAVYSVGECVQHRGVTYGLVEPIWEQCRVLADRLTATAASTYRGSKISTRLKVAGVNVVSVGERDPIQGDAVAIAIEPDGRYRRAISRDGFLVGAQVVGDPVAAAAFAKAFERQAPLAGSVGAFVFSIDTVAGPRAPAATPDDEQICVCNDVSRGTIRAAIASGAVTVDLVGDATAAGTGCGTCRPRLNALVEESRAPARDRPAA